MRRLEAKSDDELMGLIAKGDKMSFQIMFGRHAGHLLGYATTFVKVLARAEDITQEVWMKVVRLSPAYQAQGHFVSWLYTLTRNHCLNFLRNENRLVYTLDNSEGEEIQVQLVSASNIENEILSQQEVQKVKSQIENLPEAQRMALLLFAVDGLTYEEISTELNVSISAVKSLIFRARETLQKESAQRINE